MIPTDTSALRRLREAWLDSDISSTGLRGRFHLNGNDWAHLTELWGPRVPPSPMPEWGGVRRRTAKVAGTWRRKDDERNARRRDPRKGAHQ